MLTWPPTQSRTLVITIWNKSRNVATMREILWRFASILLLEQHPCLTRSFPPHCLGSRDDWTFWTQVQRPGIIASFGGQDTLLSIICSQFTDDDDVHYRVLISLMSTTVQWQCYVTESVSSCYYIIWNIREGQSVSWIDQPGPDVLNRAGLIGKGESRTFHDHLLPT